MSSSSRPLPGGGDQGAARHGETVVRTAGPWSPSVHQLLDHLARKRFSGSPRALGIDEGHERLTYLDGETVGDRRPWPGFVHSDWALAGVAGWLRDYHRAVIDFIPPEDAEWREVHEPWEPGMIIAHNDAAPYNCVWKEGSIVGFIDWDMAGPKSRLDDVAWVAFAWVPLHARTVVSAEGFADFDRRRERLELFLNAYGGDWSPEEVLTAMDRVVERQIRLMHRRAAAGDETYERMLKLGRDHDLRSARAEIAVVKGSAL